MTCLVSLLTRLRFQPAMAVRPETISARGQHRDSVFAPAHRREEK